MRSSECQPSKFPTDFSEAAVPTRADARLVQAATALQEAFAAGDAAAASRLLHPDVVLADMALRTQVIGRIESARYFDRLLARLPYGRGSVLSHSVGGARGGGFEWVAAPDNGGIRGITALDLDDDGLVTGITSVYDSRQLEPSHRSTLTARSTR